MIEDWGKLEGRIFKTDVNSTTSEAMKDLDTSVIHYTTDGDIVFNGVIFCKEKATSNAIGCVKLATLDLQSEYEFLKAAPTVTDIDEAKVAINHLRVICKTLIDKLEEAGTLTH